jgi:hypothetical protein
MLKSVICFLLLTTTAFAQTLREGVYKGQNDDVRLFLRALPEREGSFLGLIIHRGTRAVPYLVDQFSNGRYGFVPLYNQKNLIGAENYNPSLSATVIVDRNKTRVNLAPNPGNSIGFTQAMIFESTPARSPWLDTIPGTYSYDRRPRGVPARSVSLSSADASFESSLSINGGDLAGTYVLRQVRPGMHLAFRSDLTDIGERVIEESRWIVVFLEGCFGWSTKMAFIDTRNWTIREFNLN